MPQSTTHRNFSTTKFLAQRQQLNPIHFGSLCFYLRLATSYRPIKVTENQKKVKVDALNSKECVFVGRVLLLNCRQLELSVVELFLLG